MNPIRSKMGRRQFLIAAGLTSTSALAAKKLPGIASPAFKPDMAKAADGKVQANRYRNLLSPFTIGNVVFKNRMLSTKSLPSGYQGPETYPSDALMAYYAGVAKNGAAVVTVTVRTFDLESRDAQLYLKQLVDAIHFYGAKANVALTQGSEPKGYSISETPKLRLRSSQYLLTGEAKGITLEMIQEMITDFTEKAKRYQSLGFDMASFYMSYRSSILANSLSPAMNLRTDKYGGSIENRARLALDLARSIKNACGRDFLIEAQISGEEEPGGYTLDDTVAYAKLWEGAIDILQLRDFDGGSSHPLGYNSQKEHPATLRFAEAIKKSGAKIVTAPVGGFQDLDLNESYIADGKTDMIAMARAFICDPEYAKKAVEGRGEDVVPCVRCNKCHGGGCSVNPRLGIEHRVGRLIEAPERSEKVAVIGGGPAGMKAALLASERGHKVTLFEKNDFLGGQLHHADFASFQWPLRNYKDYLVRQLEKAGVEVLLRTRATPDMIRSNGYETVIVATGAEPVIPDIPGAEDRNVRTPVFVFGNEKAMGENVVVVGGNLIGTQTGMYLAENGHRVTVLTAEKSLATDAQRIHYVEVLQEAYEALENFSFITEATATRISKAGVTYVDAKGNEKTVQADSVVVSAGRQPRRKEALEFYGAAARFFLAGDCDQPGNLQTCGRSAYAAASQV